MSFQVSQFYLVTVVLLLWFNHSVLLGSVPSGNSVLPGKCFQVVQSLKSTW